MTKWPSKILIPLGAMIIVFAFFNSWIVENLLHVSPPAYTDTYTDGIAYRHATSMVSNALLWGGLAIFLTGWILMVIDRKSLSNQEKPSNNKFFSSFGIISGTFIVVCIFGFLVFVLMTFGFK